MVKVYCKEMPLDVESVSAEDEVVDMDLTFKEIQQLTHQLHANGDAKNVNYCDGENDGDKDCKRDTKFAVVHSWQRQNTERLLQLSCVDYKKSQESI